MNTFFGGEAGIRTLGTLAGTPHFECGAFDHSATSPQISLPDQRQSGSFLGLRLA